MSELHFFFPVCNFKPLAGSEDRIVCQDGVDCTFLRDLSGLQPQLNSQWASSDSPSSSDLRSLLEAKKHLS